MTSDATQMQWVCLGVELSEAVGDEQVKFEYPNTEVRTLQWTARADCMGSEVVENCLRIAWESRLVVQGEYLAAIDDADAELLGCVADDLVKLDCLVCVRRTGVGSARKWELM